MRWLMLSLMGLLLLGKLAAQDALSVEDEPRLATAFTLQEPATPLRELLGRLSRQTGLTFRVDPALASHAVVIRVNDVPLHTLLRRLAQVFDAEWRLHKQRDGSIIYWLVSTPDSRRKAATIQRVARKHLVFYIHASLQKLPKELYRLSWEEFKKRYSSLDSPARRVYGFPAPKTGESFEAYLERVIRERYLCDAADNEGRLWAAIHWMAHLTPTEVKLLAEGIPLKCPIEQLPPLVQTVLTALWERLYSDPIDQGDGDGAATRIFSLIWNDCEYSFSCYTEGYYVSEGENLLLPSGVRWLIDAYRVYCGIRQVSPPETLRGELSMQMDPAWQARYEREWWNRLAFLLIAVAERHNLQLVGEWYPLWVFSGGRVVYSTELSTCEGVANALSTAYHLQQDGNWLLLRALMPELARYYDIPQASLTRWFANRRELDLDTLAEMAAMLNRQQIEMLREFHPLLNAPPKPLRYSDYHQWQPNREYYQQRVKWERSSPYTSLFLAIENLKSPAVRGVLSFYRALSPAQRAMLHKKGELQAAELTPPQRQQLLQVVLMGSDSCYHDQLDITTQEAALELRKTESSLKIALYTGLVKVVGPREEVDPETGAVIITTAIPPYDPDLDTFHQTYRFDIITETLGVRAISIQIKLIDQPPPDLWKP